jgi:MFS family permease
MSDTSTVNSVPENKFKIKAGILMASSLQMIILGVAPTIPLLIAQFGIERITAIQSVITIPSLMVAPVGLLTGFLAVKIGKKTLLLFGIAFMAVGGLIPAFFDINLSALLGSVVIFGIGVGIVQPICTAIIPDHFRGPEIGDLIGKNTSSTALGIVLMAALGGYLAVNGWRVAFFIYFFPVIIFFIVLVLFPKDNRRKLDSQEEKPRVKITGEVFIMMVFIFFYGIFYAISSTNTAILVTEKSLGNVAMAGLATSVLSGVGIIVGLVYGKIAGVVKKGALPLGTFCITGAMFLAAFAPTIAVLFIAQAFMGAGHVIVISAGLAYSSTAVDRFSSSVAISIFLAALNVSMFVSPILCNPVSMAIADGSAQSRYVISGVALAVLTVIIFIYTRKRANNV